MKSEIRIFVQAKKAIEDGYSALIVSDNIREELKKYFNSNRIKITEEKNEKGYLLYKSK